MVSLGLTAKAVSHVSTLVKLRGHQEGGVSGAAMVKRSPLLSYILVRCISLWAVAKLTGP